MKASLSFDSNNSELIEEAVGLSLSSSDRVKYDYSADEKCFKVDISTDSVGSLRGSTDAVFRLVSLSERLR